MVIPFLGEFAALASAMIFSITSVCYTFAGRKVNAVTSLAMSLPISWVILMIVHQITLGTLFPFDATPDRWFNLGASGVLAYVVSSYFMLNAYQTIGPRLTMLIASFAPVLGAILAWLFLGQNLPPNATLGIAIVIFGIVWVVAERGKPKADGQTVDIRRGLIYAVLGTLTQASAFVFASQGMVGGFPPFSATLLRLTTSIIALWSFIALQGKLKATTASLNNDNTLLLQLTIAAISGPIIAGALLLLSFQLIPVGISTTLSHTTAIILIPIGYFVFHERITLRAIIGTIVTIVGIAIIFVR